MTYFDLDLGSASWMDRGACATVSNPATFIADVVQSPLICAGCPVIVECGQHAEANGERSGVWGGIDRGAVN